MEVSQYKDYVLFRPFIKYVRDKYGDGQDLATSVIILKGASFKDMVALKGRSDIGDKVNTQIIQSHTDANDRVAGGDSLQFSGRNRLGEDQPARGMRGRGHRCGGRAPGL